MDSRSLSSSSSSSWCHKVKDSRCLHQALHLASLVCLNIPNGMSWYFGNLVVYLNSYLYSELHATQLLTPWVISIYVVTWGLSGTLGGVLVKRAGNNNKTVVAVLFLGVFLFDAGFLLSPLAVRHSQSLFLLTFGAMLGTGLGFIQSENLTRIPKLFTGRSEIPIAVIYNSFNVGGVIFNWISTLVANPENAVADREVMSGHVNVFTQKSVLDRVPTVFFELGIATLLSHSVGFIATVILLCQDASGDSQELDSGVCAEKQNSTPTTPTPATNYMGRNSSPSTDFLTGMNENNGRNMETPLKDAVVVETSMEEVARNGKIQSEKTKLFSSPRKQITKSVVDDKKNNRPGVDIDDINTDASRFGIGDLSPVQMLQTFLYYVVATNLMINETSFLVLLNFYKMFGQAWIPDDHFMAQLGMFSIASVIVLRSILAIFLTKLGVKTTQAFVNASMSLTFLFYYFASQINRWIFAALTCLMSGLCSSVYLLSPVLTLKLFGKSHFAANNGVLMSSTILLNLVAPQCMQSVMEYLGWCALFQITGALNAVALVTSLITLPKSV